MSEAKHTPGLWKLFVSRDACPHQIFLGEKLGCVNVPHYGYHDPDGIISKKQLANAKLMAAAPELLSALEALVNGLKESDEEGLIGHTEQIINAKAAIAKAKGVKHD